MYNPFYGQQPIIVWPPMPGQTTNNGEMNIETYFKIKKILDEEAKNAKEKEKKKPEPPRFTFLESVGLNILTLPLFGAILYFGFQLTK